MRQGRSGYGATFNQVASTIALFLAWIRLRKSSIMTRSREDETSGSEKRKRGEKPAMD
jgi:hypothetical protein